VETIVDLAPEAFRLAQTVASQRHQSVGEVLSEAVIGHFKDLSRPAARFSIDEQGFPQVHVGRPISPEEVADAVEEE